MLVLTRKPGRSIAIGDSITVHVLGIAGNQVRLGIDAPRDVPILRDDAKRRERVAPRERDAPDAITPESPAV